MESTSMSGLYSEIERLTKKNIMNPIHKSAPLNKRFAFIIALTLVFTATIQLSFGQTIQGKVLDSVTGEPMVFASVQLMQDSKELPIGATVDWDGRFEIPHLETGTYGLTIRFLGYEEQVITGIEVPSNRSILIKMTGSVISCYTTCTFSNTVRILGVNIPKPRLKITPNELAAIPSIDGGTLSEFIAEEVPALRNLGYKLRSFLKVGKRNYVCGLAQVYLPEETLETYPVAPKISDLPAGLESAPEEAEAMKSEIADVEDLSSYSVPLRMEGKIVMIDGIVIQVNLPAVEILGHVTELIATEPIGSPGFHCTGSIVCICPTFRVVHEEVVEEEAEELIPEEINSLKYYPNPCAGALTVEVEGNIDVLYLRDLSGRLLQDIPVFGKQRMNLNLSTYPTGIYLLQYHDGKELQSGRVILVD